MTERQTVAGAYQKIAEHEIDCERRYAALQTSVALLTEQSQSIKTGVRVAIGGIVTIALGLIGWLGVQVYELNQERVDHLTTTAASVIARPALAPSVVVESGEPQRFQRPDTA